MNPPHKALLLAILSSITATAFSNATTNQFVGCVDIYQHKCGSCFKRQIRPDGFGCGPLQPQNDTCLFYTYNAQSEESECSECKPGYAKRTSHINGKRESQCVQRTIQDCLWEVDFEFPNQKLRYCYACQEGKYSVYNKETLTSSCQEVAKPVENCLEGGVVSANGQARCSRCQPGYALDLNSNLCQPVVQPGCWNQRSGACLVCDPFEGYSIDIDGKCFKSGFSPERVF